MATNPAVMTPTTEALPADLLYTLLLALDPKTLAKGNPKDGKFDASARREFEEVVKAADKARSAGEFAKIVGDRDLQEDTRSHGPICELVVYNSNGATFIRCRYADGVTYDSYYPAGTI